MEFSDFLDRIYVPSEDVVAREIEGEMIIVPLVSGIGDLEDDLYTLNKTGHAVWKLLAESKTLRQVAEELSRIYEGDNIQEDVCGFVLEMVRRGILVEMR
jgi:hypothetical protein